MSSNASRLSCYLTRFILISKTNGRPPSLLFYFQLADYDYDYGRNSAYLFCYRNKVKTQWFWQWQVVFNIVRVVFRWPALWSRGASDALCEWVKLQRRHLCPTWPSLHLWLSARATSSRSGAAVEIPPRHPHASEHVDYDQSGLWRKLYVLV